MSNLTPQQASDLGVEAERVLNSPAFQAAWDRMRDMTVTAWTGADVRDQEGQRLLLQQMKLIDRLKGQFVSMVGAGKAADDKLRMELAKSPLVANADLIDENVYQHGARAVRGIASRLRG